MRLDHLPALGRTRNGYAAVIFDMDGVITDTASVHAVVWKALFDQVLDQIGAEQEPFDADHDYHTYVDGRARESGIRTFLAARGLELPTGAVDDPPDRLTVHGLAARKQHLFTDILTRTGVSVFPDAQTLLTALRAMNVPTALVTSSRNSLAVLDAAEVASLFDVRVDGLDAQRLSLAGKPDPAMFVEAARRLAVPPADTVVFEDAPAGVRAAVDGGFGLVVGVDRTGIAEQLTAAGADVVVTDLLGVPLTESSAAVPGRTRPEPWCGGAVPTPRDGWTLIYDRFDPAQEGTREALCTLGNGYWATRGAVLGSTADAVHYPGTYLAGLYNRLTTALEGHLVETEHLVNAPDWTYLTVRSADGDLFRPGSPQMLTHHQELDLRTGVLTRINRYRDSTGCTLRVTSRQIQSLTEPHLAALEVTVDADTWSGDLVVESAVNADVANHNVRADHALDHHHLNPVATTEIAPDTVLAEVVTNQSSVSIATAVRTRVRAAETVPDRRPVLERTYAGHSLAVHLEPGTSVVVEKVAAVATSRDRALSTAALAAKDRIARAPHFDDLLDAHRQAWTQLWERFGIDLRATPRQSMAMNLHIFHVLQTVATAGTDLDAGLPARGLHGEGYRGHIFWDELFVYPMLSLRRPDLTRSLLLYRYRRLDSARAAAAAAGLDGAMFPWQSGSDGREETPTQLFNVRNGTWMPDNSHRQRHVGLAVAYSVWQYYQATADLGFLVDYGAEILVEVARLFASLAVYDPTDDRFDITGVMGPDEYHDGYPDAPGRGLRNNAYTNVLAAWVLARAEETVTRLADHDCAPLWRRLRLAPDEPARWDRVGRRLRIPFHDGVISQFDGYHALREFDWETYRARYGNIGRLDLILQAEGDSTNRYKLSKQADVLMLFYLFSAEELRAVFTRLGYALPAEMIPRTVRYYLARTSHGSTLSRLVHGWVLARTDRTRSWELFTQALEADLADTQGGTTREGVHLGAMAGTADMVLRCYGGIETRQDALWLHPVLPAGLTAASFRLSYRGQPISVELTQHHARVVLHPCSTAPVRLCIKGIEKTLAAGEVWDVPLSSAPSETSPPPPPSTQG
ncbi:beta-phosphoglucomutase family hydrolase [Rhodococcus pyridinivorans]|uniref:beta-phosphoglucomutase family hydrolase n=1 Tax=Rhodococcus pyridinivorans TaxID=103816 RepID=UPI002283D6A6|nr:beta-phosphoglucomutase family hydrolase [Rhodococcus pyridinivorans]WAL49773.1 beta-phosphoglucomutase family hydrolase [Rhodococcus pyridinivorans]